jgi:cytochrome P450
MVRSNCCFDCVLTPFVWGSFTDVENGEEFGMGDRPEVWFPLIGPGIFTQDGEDWKHSRELLRPLFLSKRFDNFLEVQESAEALLKCIPTDRSLVDFQPLFFRFTLDTTTYLLFGRSIRSLADENKEAESFGNSFRVAQNYLAQRGRLGPLHWMLNTKEFREANATVHRWIDGEIKEALENSEKEQVDLSTKPTDYGFLGSLMRESRDPKVLRDALLNILLAGRDTTACMLTWTMRLLVKHEKVMAKLQEEIKSIVGVGEEARLPNRNDMKKMLYLSYVLKEGILPTYLHSRSLADMNTVLRLYPSVPLNSRAATKTTILPTGGGPDGKAPVFVKKGTAIGYTVYAMHRRKELYGNDAGSFRPERWDPDVENEVNLKSIGWGYLPFNGGPRVCIGRK